MTDKNIKEIFNEVNTLDDKNSIIMENIYVNAIHKYKLDVLNPNHIIIFQNLATCYCMNKKYQLSLSILEKLPINDRTLSDKGIAYFKSNEYYKAYAAFLDLKTKYPNFSGFNVHAEILNCLLAIDDWSELNYYLSENINESSVCILFKQYIHYKGSRGYSIIRRLKSNRYLTKDIIESLKKYVKIEDNSEIDILFGLLFDY
jgi:tetratricopeptide (TPR) repeat protein